MIRFASSSTSIERTYRRALRVYPAQFRACYSEAMLQSLHDALADPDLPRPALLRTLWLDLIQSLIKENFAMLRDTFSRPILLYNALVLMALVTVLCLGFVIMEQNMLRQSANDPQMGMAADVALRVQHGTSPADAVPASLKDDRTDMDASLSPFVIVYGEEGQVLASSAELQGAVPRPPAGVFDYAKRHDEEDVTWAPRRDVRIASIVRHISGGTGGYVLAGRNLREVEARKELILEQGALVWLGLLATIAAGTFLFGWLTRGPKPATV